MSVIKNKKNRVSLLPHELNNIPLYIREHLQKTMENCTKDDGYILDIVDIISYNNNIIQLSSSNIVFDVEYTIECIKPNIGDEYLALVNIIFKEGIFTECDRINILIPANTLKDYTYTNNKFVKNTNEIKCGDWINLRIISVRYENHSYQCIGELIEN